MEYICVYYYISPARTSSDNDFENFQGKIQLAVKTLWFVLFGFYGISTFVGNLMPNPFLYK